MPSIKNTKRILKSVPCSFLEYDDSPKKQNVDTMLKLEGAIHEIIGNRNDALG